MEDVIKPTKYVIGASYRFSSAKKRSQQYNGRIFELLKYSDQEPPLIRWLDTGRCSRISLDDSTMLDYIPDDHELISIGIVIISTGCWKCKKTVSSIAGIRLSCQDGKYSQFYNFPFLLESLLERDCLKSCIADNQIGELKLRFSHTANGSYFSNGCFHCDSIVGDFYLRRELFEWLSSGTLPAPTCNIFLKYDRLKKMLAEDILFKNSEKRQIKYIEPVELTEEYEELLKDLGL